MKNLNPKIVEKLVRDLRVSPKTVRNNIYSLAQQYPKATPNALAQIYAQKNGKTVLRMLDPEDRQAFPSANASVIATSPNQKGFRVIQIGKELDRWYNNWLVQLIIAFFVVGIVAGTIAQVFGIFIAKLLGIN